MLQNVLKLESEDQIKSLSKPWKENKRIKTEKGWRDIKQEQRIEKETESSQLRFERYRQYEYYTATAAIYRELQNIFKGFVCFTRVAEQRRRRRIFTDNLILVLFLLRTLINNYRFFETPRRQINTKSNIKFTFHHRINIFLDVSVIRIYDPSQRLLKKSANIISMQHTKTKGLVSMLLDFFRRFSARPYDLKG